MGKESLTTDFHIAYIQAIANLDLDSDPNNFFMQAANSLKNFPNDLKGSGLYGSIMDFLDGDVGVEKVYKALEKVGIKTPTEAGVANWTSELLVNIVRLRPETENPFEIKFYLSRLRNIPGKVMSKEVLLARVDSGSGVINFETDESMSQEVDITNERVIYKLLAYQSPRGSI